MTPPPPDDAPNDDTSEDTSNDYLSVFRAFPAAALMLDGGLRIEDANPAYLSATGRSHDDLVGRHMFEAFPGNPHVPDGDEGVANLAASLEQVLRTREPHSMPVQRYDVPSEESPAGFVEKYWCPTNAPIFDADGELTGILHTVEDVTAFHDDIVATHEFFRQEIESAGNVSDDPVTPRLADYAQVAMRNARFYPEAVAEVENLREALRFRDLIGQAKGILMAENSCGPDEAFELLVENSQLHNVKLREIAAALVGHVADSPLGRRAHERADEDDRSEASR